MNAAAVADSEDLEALFDSIVMGQNASETPAEAGRREKPGPEVAAAGDVMSRIGQLTRMLHDALRELGYDRMLEKAAATIPDARDRLSYVAMMTEQAATRALSAAETAKPIQERLEIDAQRLSGQWQQLFDRRLTVREFEALVAGTRTYLGEVPERARATKQQLLEIMMAQEFQDLTGQVIKKITDLSQNMERQLVQLLVDLVPAEKRSEIEAGLLSGPVVNAGGRSDVVTSQNQVDDLLESLGF